MAAKAGQAREERVLTESDFQRTAKPFKHHPPILTDLAPIIPRPTYTRVVLRTQGCTISSVVDAEA